MIYTNISRDMWLNNYVYVFYYIIANLALNNWVELSLFYY